MADFRLSTRSIEAGYTPDVPIVKGVSIALSDGEIMTIIGPNGAGKSTFMKAIAGLVPVSTGEVYLSGQKISGMAASSLVSAGLAYVPQTGNVFTTLTIEENLILGGYVLRKGLRERLTEIYATFPLLEERKRTLARTLSGGQRQLLAIARALMTRPRVLMLDEPSAGLSPIAVKGIFADLQRLAKSGIAILMVEQNAKAGLRISDRGLVLVDGVEYMTGSAQALLNDPKVGAAFLGGVEGGA